MPLIQGKFIAPRSAPKKQQNGALVVVWLAFRLIAAELKANSGDWDKVISVFRVLLGEDQNQRMDFNGDGSRVRYSEMARFIQQKRDEWGAH